MRARTALVIAVMLAALAGYAVLIGARGVALLGTGSAPAVALGAAVLVVPAVGVVVVVREIAFGRSCARLATVLAAEQSLPEDDLARRPSGRVDRAAADALFARVRRETEAEPESWRAWFRLALAYDAAGDRRRARGAARHAVELAGPGPTGAT